MESSCFIIGIGFIVIGCLYLIGKQIDESIENTEFGMCSKNLKNT